MSEKIKVGDVVMLRSGGPLMTVDKVVDNASQPSVECVWHEGAEFHTRNFATATIQFVPEGKRPHTINVGAEGKQAFTP